MTWNRPINDKKAVISHHRNRNILVWIGGIAIVLLISFFLFRNESEPANETSARHKTSVKPKNPEIKDKSNSEKQSNKSRKEACPPTVKNQLWMGREIVKETVVTNGTDLIITRTDAEGKRHKEYTSTSRTLFSNPIDIVLSILLTTPEGAPIPPLPPLGPRSIDRFTDALRTPIAITEEDFESDRKIKSLVQAAREEMLEELAAGRSVNEIIEDHCTYVDRNNTFRAEVAAQYRALVSEGDDGLAEDFRVKANCLLREKGANPIKSFEEAKMDRDRLFNERRSK